MKTTVGANEDQGSVYFFVRIGTIWTQQQKISASDGARGDAFGISVAISGDTAVVGADADDLGDMFNQGSAYVFVRSGTMWTQQQKLSAPDGGAYDNFGISVAVSGDTAVVGGGPNGLQDAAYVFVRNGSTWTQQQKLSSSDGAAGYYFGASVAIFGDTAVVGGGANGNQGSAYVFVRDGTTWAPQQKLSVTAGAAGDHFGNDVAVSGDTAVVGAASDDVGTNRGQGSAYVFVRGGIWTLQQKLRASDGEAGDYFGASVSISGDTVVIGAALDDLGASIDQGSAYVFVRSGSTWTQQQTLSATDGAAFDYFGSSVAVSGNSLLVGNPASLSESRDQGLAYVFVRIGTTWTQQQKLSAADGAKGDGFGGVAVSGDTAVIGAPRDDVGANEDQGSAYVFIRSGTTWIQQQKLKAVDGAAFDYFGVSVAVSGDTVVVGAFLDDLGTSFFNQGSAYVFVRSGSTWTQQRKLSAADGTQSDDFGSSVGVSGDTVVVGAPGDNIDSTFSQGSAYVFLRGGSNWTQKQKLNAADGAAQDIFGNSVAISGNTVVVGAQFDDNPSGVDAGAAYIYRIATDYGDAPDPYPTLLTDNGARHFVSGPKLGTTVDAELDGQPNSGATGDDIAGIDDENGVSFGALSAGKSATVNVGVVGGPTLLDAWVDFNRDGDWADAGERIFDHYIVLDGHNDGLVFQVPAAAVAGISYARVRLSSDGVSDVTGAAVDGEVEDEQVTIIAAATLGVVDAGISEGNSGTKNLTFTVGLSKAASRPVSVRYATANGTAKSDSDYNTKSGTLNFAVGEKAKNVSVVIRGDVKIEPDETFLVKLSNPVGATIADSSGIGTIRNDDSSSASPSIRINDVSLTEGPKGDTKTAKFTVTLSRASTQTVTVSYATSNGTAVAPADYTAKNGALSFAPGATSKSVSVTVKGDSVREPDETFRVNLSNPATATIGDGLGVGTIRNDD